jgi:hypothetical protein
VELAIFLSLWNNGEIERPTQESLKAVLRYLVLEIESLTTSNLFDVWLRVQDGPPETRKAAS